MYKTTHRKEGKFSMNNDTTEKYTVVVGFMTSISGWRQVSSSMIYE